MSDAPATLWRHRDFLHLWAAQALSAFGSRLTRTAVPVIAITMLDAAPWELSLLTVSAVLPGVAVGLFAGGFVDRRRKRPLLVAADLARASCLLTVPAAAWLGALGLWQLCAVAAIAGGFTTVFRIADNAYLPALVGRRNLPEGNAKLEATDAVAEIAGPGAAGVLIHVAGAPVALAVDAATYLWSAALLGRIRTVEVPSEAAPRVSVWHDVAVGWRASLSHPLVRPTLIAGGVQSFFGGFFAALYVLFALTAAGLDVATLGLVIGMGGVGALAGALVAERLAKLSGAGPAMIAAMGAGQAAALLIPLAAGAGSLAVPLLVAHQLLGDALLVAYFIHATSLRQSVLPEASLGRANAAFHVTDGALTPLGALAAGALAEVAGVESAVWIGVVGGLAAIAPLAVPALRRLQSYT